LHTRTNTIPLSRTHAHARHRHDSAGDGCVTNCIIEISSTVSSKFLQLYYWNVTNPVISNFIISLSPPLFFLNVTSSMSKLEGLQLYHWNVTNSIIEMSPSRLLKCHQLFHWNVSISIMGLLRLVGFFKLYVSFAKEPYKRDYILQKRPYNFKEPTNRSHPISNCYQLYYLNDSNSTIEMSPTLSSKCHQLYSWNVTNAVT
jgi:hypothetical protein